MTKNRNLVRDILPAKKSGVVLPVKKEPLFQTGDSGRRSGRRTKFAGTRSHGGPRTRKSFFSFNKAPAPRNFKLVVASVILYAIAVVALDFFAKAEVNIVFKSEPMNLNDVFSASSADTDILSEKIVFDSMAESSAKTTTIRNFSERASGIIVIYNSYSSESQPLVAKTRFNSPDGKTYRIDKGLTVPGAKIIDGRIEPSSIEARVYAEEPGEGYNMGLTDFTIPGFQGSSKYEKFYARSKTPMEGGFVGQARIVTEEDVEDLKKSLAKDLENELYFKMTSELPDEFLVFDRTYEFDTEVIGVVPDIGERADEFHISLSGKLQTFFIRKEDIKMKILERYQNDFHFDSISIPDFDRLEISARDLDFENLTLNLVVTGSADAVWVVEKGRLAEELALAASSAERTKIFEKYPQIKKAEIVHKPYWWKVFPDKTNKVIINGSY